MSGLIVPIGAALVLAVMTLPLTNWLDRYMPRGFAVGCRPADLVAAAVVALAVIFTKGVAEQIPAIEASIQAGIAKIEDALGIDHEQHAASPTRRPRQAPARRASSAGLKGLTGFLVSSVDSLVSLFFGVFIGDDGVLPRPAQPEGDPGLGRRGCCPGRRSRPSGCSRPRARSSSTTTRAARSWPASTRSRSGSSRWSLDIKPAGAIFVVLFVSSYIPYIGAWIGGAFAVIMALGLRRHDRRLDHARQRCSS